MSMISKPTIALNEFSLPPLKIDSNLQFTPPPQCSSATPSGPTQVSPRVLGYEIDETELASELQSQHSDTLEEHTTPEIEPDQFESVYGWFLA